MHFHKDAGGLQPDVHVHDLAVCLQAASRAPLWALCHWHRKRETCDQGGRLPCDVEFDHRGGFQGSAWLILGEKKKIETSL